MIYFRKTGCVGFLICCLLIGITSCAGKKSLLDLTPGRERPRIALVLGGGAAKGFAHVGVIRVLEQEKIPIDMIIGTSVGSLVGALYADKADSFELEWKSFELQKDDIFDFTIFGAKTGPVRGNKLEEFIDTHVKARTIEKLAIEYAAVAVDLKTGEQVVIDNGPVAKAVRASSSIPGIFQPLQYRGRFLVDGGVLGSIAPEVARAMGADIVITVDIGGGIRTEDISNIISITIQAINIMADKISQYKYGDTDILIKPDVSGVGTMDFSRKKHCMQAGIAATRAKMDEIKKVIDEW